MLALGQEGGGAAKEYKMFNESKTKGNCDDDY